MIHVTFEGRDWPIETLMCCCGFIPWDGTRPDCADAGRWTVILAHGEVRTDYGTAILWRDVIALSVEPDGRLALCPCCGARPTREVPRIAIREGREVDLITTPPCEWCEHCGPEGCDVGEVIT